MKEQKNFRKSVTLSGKNMLAGKNASQNEKIIAQAGKNEFVLHTSLPGSPFVNIKANAKEVSKEDLREAAIFCAKHSQAWKKQKSGAKKDVEIHVFLGKDIFKAGDMKLGTFGVKKAKKIVVRKEDLLA